MTYDNQNSNTNFVDSLIQLVSGSKVRNRHDVTCDKEQGKWSVRINGVLIESYYRRAAAEKLVERIETALEARN